MRAAFAVYVLLAFLTLFGAASAAWIHDLTLTCLDALMVPLFTLAATDAWLRHLLELRR